MSKPSLEVSCVVDAGFIAHNEDKIDGVSLGVGLGAGVTFNMGGNTTYAESISLTYGEIKSHHIPKYKQWSVGQISAIKNDKGEVTGFSGKVFYGSQKQNSFVEVYSKTKVKSNGQIVSDGIWKSKMYINEEEK